MRITRVEAFYRHKERARLGWQRKLWQFGDRCRTDLAQSRRGTRRRA